jgi:hypothetical protein
MCMDNYALYMIHILISPLASDVHWFSMYFNTKQIGPSSSRNFSDMVGPGPSWDTNYANWSFTCFSLDGH